MKKACVIGWPIRHSRSPLIHRFWLQQYGIEGDYDKQEVSPESLPEFITRVGVEFAGCNVTVPHKEKIVDHLDVIDETAKAVGAVNTVWVENGKRYGMNTDVFGFLTNLDQQAPDWDGKPFNAVVLGAGGAARAIIFGLVQRGARSVCIINRSRDRAQELAEEFGAVCSAAGFEHLPSLLGQTHLLVNATSLGMDGKPKLPVSLDGLNPEAVVADIVYSPLITDLLHEARARGNRTADGLGMLIHQARFGFEKWFGVLPDAVPELRLLLEEDLKAEAR